MTWHMVHMAGMGLLVSVAAPALALLLVRTAPGLDRWSPPARIALPGFVVLHALITMWPVLQGHSAGQGHPAHHHATHHAMGHGPLTEPLLALALAAGAVLFWAPVLGVRRRLPDAGRTLYLFTAMPLLDLAGVWLVASGDQAGGLSMIVGMLPMGLTMVAVTWNWVAREERRVALTESAGAGR